MAHTYDVRTDVRDIVQLVTNAQDSLAQYFSTAGEQHARAIEMDLAQTRSRLAQLRALTIDDPPQQQNIQALEPLVMDAFAKIREAQRRVTTTGHTFPADVNEQGQQSMRTIREAARQMMQREERLLLARTNDEARISREVELIFVVAIVLTLALLLWARRRLGEYAAQRDRAELELQRTVDQIETLNRQLEGRVEERTAQLREVNTRLAQSNDDLERFAYIASHDLQEPLRVVTLYSQLLVRSCQGMLDARGFSFIESIIEATNRMLDLLSSLLIYAEMGVGPEPAVSPVDLNSVLQTALQNLATSIKDAGAEIVCAPLPVLKVSEAHFVQLFQNLIGNAIKYRSDRPPRIKISVKSEGENFEFAVADNGIGIEPEYQEKVFIAFKRLHGRQIPGTGIGLAICRRALDWYGGRIWVESQAGQGATFYFTVPAALRCDQLVLEQRAK